MFCFNCGHNVANEQIFCAKCGTRIRQSESGFISNSNDEPGLIKHYFAKGLRYETMIICLQRHHNICISLRTLKRRLNELGLSKRKLPQESDETVRSIIEREIQGPGNLKGYRGMWHKLKTTYGISVARDKVMRLLHAAGPEDSAMRKGRKLTRRCYISPGPNATWHVDGYDKLKPYGFPIHGCIDGFSRRILWFQLATKQ
eukprot:gene1193-564_t